MLGPEAVNMSGDVAAAPDEKKKKKSITASLKRAVGMSSPRQETNGTGRKGK